MRAFQHRTDDGGCCFLMKDPPCFEDAIVHCSVLDGKKARQQQVQTSAVVVAEPQEPYAECDLGSCSQPKVLPGRVACRGFLENVTA